MTKRPHILITNDDGINAPGIKHLWKALEKIATVTVVAPLVEQSAVGVSITIRQPLRIDKIDWHGLANVWGVNGTPADCVKLGLNILMKTPPDLIVSGINRGTNAGRNILYSGTVGGVIEGVMHDIPGVAFSCRDFVDPDYHTAEQYVPRIVSYILEHPLSTGTLLNVNFPGREHPEIKGLKLTRQGQEFWAENLDERRHPTEGHVYYWLGAKLMEYEEHHDSDIAWLKKGYATAVPVQVGELTDHLMLKDRKSHFEGILDLST